METKRPIIAIVGQTASGKSALALQLASKYDGEIICADSRTVYRGMDIGTAKPSPSEQKAVPHHCLDIVEPDEYFSAAEFKKQARKAIQDIHDRDKVAFVVGGSGLYVDGLLYDFQFSEMPDPSLRKGLETMSLSELQQKANDLGISLNDVNFLNKRHLSRAIERGGVSTQRSKLPENVLIVGIKIDKIELEKRITDRVNVMISDGLEAEIKKLLKTYDVSSPGFAAPGYKAFIEYINKKIDLDQAKNEFIRADKKLAKRQATWFKRNLDIVWIKNYSDADKTVGAFIKKFATMSK